MIKLSTERWLGLSCAFCFIAAMAISPIAPAAIPFILAAGAPSAIALITLDNLKKSKNQDISSPPPKEAAKPLPSEKNKKSQKVTDTKFSLTKDFFIHMNRAIEQSNLSKTTKEVFKNAEKMGKLDLDYINLHIEEKQRSPLCDEIKKFLQNEKKLTREEVKYINSRFKNTLLNPNRSKGTFSEKLQKNVSSSLKAIHDTFHF